ncbi:hypothetical protein WA588_002037 [Blastocystis sp. NMH]
MDFQRLGLCDELIKAIEMEGWERPTDCQEEAIPLILGGGDVLLAAPTGSGKTAAFGLPVLQIVWEMLQLEAPTQNQKTELGMNYLDSEEGIAVSSDGLTVSNSKSSWAGCRGTIPVTKSGRYYYECRMEGNPKGICRVGWSTLDSSLNLGTSKRGYGFGATGNKATSNQFAEYGVAFGVGDIIGCTLDLDAGTISFSKNGTDLGVAFSGVNASMSYYPAVCLKNASISVRFAAPFAHLPPDCLPLPQEETPVPAGPRSLLALILEPTRELAQQTFECLEHFRQYMSHPAVNVGLLIGGERIDWKKQKKLLEASHIVVATTNIFYEAMIRNNLRLENLLFFIMDEADKLVEDSENNNLMKIYGRIPARATQTGEYRLQTCLFSATLHSPAIRSLAEAICVNPIWVDLKGKDYVPDRVQQVFCMVDARDPAMRTRFHGCEASAFTDHVHPSGELTRVETKEEVSEAMKRMKLNVVKRLVDEYAMDRVMIFCRTNLDCDNLEAFFNKEGNGEKMDAQHPLAMGGRYPCCVLAGMRDTASRHFALESFKNGATRILICTDVAARGIDVKELPFVINMTLPDSVEQYIHRIGRVGRADAVGLSISIVGKEEEKVWYHTCKKSPKERKHCRNTKLTSEGGCCIWMNEMEMAEAIEERVGITIPLLKPDLSLPEGIDLGNVHKTKNDKLIEIAVKNAATIQKNVEVLTRLESETQFAYLYLKGQQM